ncbi:MAG: YceI family protein [Bacteroidota bacterium]|nr:YceI family protein [Bacteroidota bacterium]
MFFKLVKDLPWMFVIAILIWLAVLILFFRNNKTKNVSFLKKHVTTFFAILIALIFTIADIWIFVQYIPTHFRKNQTVEQTLSTADLLNDVQPADTSTKKIITTNKKDSAAHKIAEAKPAAIIYSTNKASIRFFSSTSEEDIEATNNQTASALNNQTGDLRFVALIKSFRFENELMQDHFNEKDYMNSDAFPKSEFKGKITNINSINFSKDSSYNVTATGSLTIHGVTKKITAPGTLTIAHQKINLKSVFKINRIDYGITSDEVGDTLEITVIATYN